MGGQRGGGVGMCGGDGAVGEYSRARRRAARAPGPDPQRARKNRSVGNRVAPRVWRAALGRAGGGGRGRVASDEEGRLTGRE